MGDFLFPDVGEGIHEGKLVAWKVTEGQAVKQDQVLAEVETDKAVVEIPAPQAGVVTRLHHAVGAVITVGAPLVTFGDAGSVPTAAPTQATSTPQPIQSTPSAPHAPTTNEFKRPIESGTKKIESSFVPTPPAALEHAPASTTANLAPSVNAASPHRTLAAPSTRRLAREKGVDIERVNGTGTGGRITDADIITAAGGASAPAQTIAPPATTATPAQPTPQPITSPVTSSLAATPSERFSYSGRRRAIGEHMVQSHAMPAVTEFAQADVTALMGIREHLKASAEKEGVKLTPLAFFVKAAAITLRKHAILNSTIVGDEIDTFADIHLGIAMDTPKGLIVPVIKNAERLSIGEIARAIQTLADAAHADKLTLAQIKGSTFSISSIGPMRVQGFTPMLNAPEEAILGIGAVQDLPWVVNGAVVPRKIVTLSLTFDHRAADGAEAARFMTDLIAILEEPDRLLLGSS